MIYIEGSKYVVDYGIASQILLVCNCVQDGFVYLKSLHGDADYRLHIKSNKLHMFNTKYMSWDNIENTLSEYTADDIWSKRTGNGSGGGYYSNTGQS